MKNPLSCADFTFPLLEHEKVLQLIGLLGFKGVDLGLFEGRSHLQPSAEFKQPEKSGRALRQKLSRQDLHAADVFLQTAPDFFSLAPNHPSPPRRKKAREMFLRTLDYAQACGSPHVSCLPGVYFSKESKRHSWERCVEELRWRVEQARKADQIFGVEAHIGSIAPRPADALRLVENVPGLTLTLDFTHFAYQGIADRATMPLVKHATHFHLRGAARRRLQASVKDNKIDYHAILKKMRQTGYRGYIGVEYVWIDWEHCNEVDNLAETILWRDFLHREMKTPARG